MPLGNLNCRRPLLLSISYIHCIWKDDLCYPKLPLECSTKAREVLRDQSSKQDGCLHSYGQSYSFCCTAYNSSCQKRSSPVVTYEGSSLFGIRLVCAAFITPTLTRVNRCFRKGPSLHPLPKYLRDPSHNKTRVPASGCGLVLPQIVSGSIKKNAILCWRPKIL